MGSSLIPPGKFIKVPPDGMILNCTDKPLDLDWWKEELEIRFPHFKKDTDGKP